MSIFGKVAGFFSGAVDSVVNLAKRVFGAIGTVWSFLVSAATLVTDAWNWLVNGVTWFTSQVSDWAAAVYTTAWHTLTSVIPRAAEWAFRQATSWAGAALHGVEGFLRGLIHNLSKWAVGEFDAVRKTITGWVHSIVGWVKGPLEWIAHTARHAVNLILHPVTLAEYLVGHLIEPLVLWFLRAGANVIKWLLHLAVRDSSEVAHLLEELLEKVI